MTYRDIHADLFYFFPLKWLKLTEDRIKSATKQWKNPTSKNSGGGIPTETKRKNLSILCFHFCTTLFLKLHLTHTLITILQALFKKGNCLFWSQTTSPTLNKCIYWQCSTIHRLDETYNLCWALLSWELSLIATSSSISASLDRGPGPPNPPEWLPGWRSLRDLS